MTTSPVNVSGLNGAGAPIQVRAQQSSDASQSLALQTVAEYGGSAALVPAVSAALGAGLVLKASAGTLFALNLNATASGYFLLFDSATIPPDGAVTPLKAWWFSASVNATLDLSFQPPLAFSAGITVAFSSAATPFTKTASAAAMISGEVA